MQTIQSAAQAVAPMLQQAEQQQPYTQASVPNGMLPQQTLVSDPNELASLANEPGVVVPANNQTAMYRGLVETPNGLNASNSTPLGQASSASAFGPGKGTYGTDYSATYTDTSDPRKLDVLIPQIFEGKVHGFGEAVKHYQQSKSEANNFEGEHFGKFSSVKEAQQRKATGTSDSDRYAEKFHKRKQTLNGKLYTGPENE
jgi:hypothetical protein